MSRSSPPWRGRGWGFSGCGMPWGRRGPIPLRQQSSLALQGQRHHHL